MTPTPTTTPISEKHAGYFATHQAALPIFNDIIALEVALEATQSRATANETNLRTSQHRVAQLESALETALEYFADREDADHNGQRFVGNKEMKIAQELREAMSKEPQPTVPLALAQKLRDALRGFYLTDACMELNKSKKDDEMLYAWTVGHYRQVRAAIKEFDAFTKGAA